MNDQIYIEEKCDSFQPSCNDDSNCSPGYACCFAGNSYTGACYTCQGNFKFYIIFLHHIWNLKLIENNVLLKMYLIVSGDLFAWEVLEVVGHANAYQMFVVLIY